MLEDKTEAQETRRGGRRKPGIPWPPCESQTPGQALVREHNGILTPAPRMVLFFFTDEETEAERNFVTDPTAQLRPCLCGPGSLLSLFALQCWTHILSITKVV